METTNGAGLVGRDGFMSTISVDSADAYGRATKQVRIER
jgi:hypothetical protein